jgi:hypothetical protein
MSKAEEKSLLEFPDPMGPGSRYDDTSILREAREAYVKGYREAERDKALTWQDMRTIATLFDEMVDEDVKGDIPNEWNDEQYYRELLRRYNNYKNR